MFSNVHSSFNRPNRSDILEFIHDTNAILAELGSFAGVVDTSAIDNCLGASK
jgi:hypothetical protein